MRMSIKTNQHTISATPPASSASSASGGGPLDVDAVTRLIDEHFPGMHSSQRIVSIESVGERRARCRLEPRAANIRPGGTISGPAMFMLADFTIYVALIATIGAPALPAVTSNLNINFLLRPDPVDLIADAFVIRMGRRLSYAEVRLFSAGRSDLIAHATGSYAMGART